MRKYRVYIWITIILATLAVILYTIDNQGTLKVDNREFAVSDTSSVTKIKISDGKSALTLERQGIGWTVNEQFNAKPKTVKALLGVISGLEISSPVSKSMTQDIFNGFSFSALSISIESSGNVIKAYRISENDSIRIGSFALLSGDNTPYVIHIMGYEGRITKLFPVDPRFWRDKTLFSYRPADILTIEIEYPLHPENSFAYQFFSPGVMKIKSLSNNQTISIDKNKARSYLLNFSSVPFQLVESVCSKMIYDSLVSQKPFCEIRVKNSGNKVKTVRTYRIPNPKNPVSFNNNIMYALIQDDNIPIIIKYIDLDLIMRNFSDFVSK